MPNYVIRDIMYRFDITEEAARKVYREIWSLDIDFSECSEEEYSWATNYAYNKWRKKELADFDPFVKEVA